MSHRFYTLKFSASKYVHYFRFKKNLWVTRKNLLFTKQLAFDGARAIFEGSDRSTEIGAFNAARPLNGLVWIYPQYLLSFAKQ